LVAATVAAMAVATGGALGGTPSGFSAELRRYPYLTDVVGTSATVSWATDSSATASSVSWGEVGQGCAQQRTAATSRAITVKGVAEIQWTATFTVRPDTRYCYRVAAGPGGATDLLGSDPSPQFTSALPAGSKKPFTFAVVGDWGQTGLSGTNSHQAGVLSHLAQSGARFAVSTGDIAYPVGSEDNYGDLLQRGPDLSTVFAPEFWAVPGARIPLFPATGNHGFDQTFLSTWPQAHAAQTSGGRYQVDTYCCTNGTASAQYPSVWYAFDAGNARFYVLTSAWDEVNLGTSDQFKNDFDNHWTPSSPEYQWLKADLAAHPGGLKFAFSHYPLYSAHGPLDSDTFLRGPSSLEGLLHQYGASLLFNGHDHNYVRNVAPTGGVISTVTGGGGAALGVVQACGPPVAYAIGWSNPTSTGSSCGGAPVPDDISRVYHFLKVSVQGNRVTVTPTDERGRTFDIQTYTFAPPVDKVAPTPPSNLTASLGATGVNLTWGASSDNVGVTNYDILRNGAPLATVGAVTTFADTTTAPGKTYSYEVRARDAAGNVSPPSNAASIAVPIPDTTAPGAPSGLSAQVATGRVTLTWLAASDNLGVTNYEILRNGAALATVGAVTTFTDTTTAPGTTYSYQVRARDAAGNLSAPSSVVTVAIAPSGGNTTTPTVLSQVLRPQASAPKPGASTSGQSTAGRATTALTGGATGLLARTGIIALGAGAALLVAGTGSCYEPKHRGRRRRRGRHSARRAASRPRDQELA
jgi:chitodextrinase